MVELTIEGIPPNWLNRTMHHMVAYRLKQEWAQKVREAALRDGVRVKAREGDRHRVQVVFRYAGSPKDHEGAVACAKPLIDILQAVRRIRMPNRKYLEMPGIGLIWKDDLEHVGKPEIDQERVATRAEQRTVIRVWREEA